MSLASKVSAGDDLLWFALILLCVGLLGFFWGLRTYLRRKLILQTPTSKVQSAALGRVELQGKVPEKVDLVSPLCIVPCAYYRYQVEKEYRNKKGRTTWSTVLSGASGECFYLQDDTGFMLVDPTGADIDIPQDYQETFGGIFNSTPLAIRNFMESQGVTDGGKRMRFTEWRLEANDPLFIFGTLFERKDLKERSLVPHENLIVQGKSRYYLISDASEKEELNRMFWRVIGGVFGGAAAAIGGVGILLHIFGIL